MSPEMELWSPDQELQLLEEIAERESKAFEFDLGPAVPPVVAQAERSWVAYWQLPQNDLRQRPRGSVRGR